MSHTMSPPAEAPPTPASIVLSFYLRRLRQAKGALLSDAAYVAGTSLSTINRWELGQVRAPSSSLEAVLQFYGVRKRDAEYLAWHQPPRKYTRSEDDEEGLARRAPYDFWPDLTGAEAMVRYLAVMRVASSIIEYRMRVPAGLRTPAYRAAMADSVLPADADDAVLEESSWARHLQRPEGQRRTVLLDETVLTRPLGGPTVMAGQLRHLAGLVSEESPEAGLTIRILPMTYVGDLHGVPAPAEVVFEEQRLVTYLSAYPAYESGSGAAKTMSEALHAAVPAAFSREETLQRLRGAAEAMERGAAS
ncbi:Scr1 family TA system antitoxin-like transcriptional regulator [Streptomyces albidoflavus]